MNKQEYMRQLEIKLKRLPKDDFERAIEYYEEYFAEAGEEHEQKAIEDLGSPQEAADQIIKDFALNYSKEPVKDVKSGMNALWVGVLALFAAPLALPLMAAGIVLCFAMGIVVLSLLVALVLTAASTVLIGPFSIIAGFMSITKSVPVFLTCVGMGLLATAAGSALTYTGYVLCRRFISWILKKLAGMIRRGEKNNDQ